MRRALPLPPRRIAAAVFVLLGAALPAAEPRTIALPPFLVEEAARPLPWRYAAVAEWEILSTCSERFTRTLVANHYRLHALLGELLPPELRFATSTPQALIFLDSAHQPPTSREVVTAMALTAAEQDRLEHMAEPLDDGRLRRRPPPPRYTFLPNLRLWDRDSGTLFAVFQEKDFRPERVALTADYVAYLLRQRLPALPPWYVSGVLTLFARAQFSDDTLTLGRQDWLSETGAAALRGGPAANRTLLPLAEFFAGDLAAAEAGRDDTLALWQAQAALFVRWGLAGRGSPRRDALKAFVARAATEPVTEELFRSCFGFDFTEAHRQLTAYLPEAMRAPLDLRASTRLRPPDYPLRPATEAEIARLKGELERLQIGWVKTHFPVLVPRYVEQAQRTLRRPAASAPPDPRLLAILGLCEIDAGRDAEALPFLEAAAATPVPLRPRAASELAPQRFAAAAGTGTAPALTGEQVETVLAPLAAARNLSPPLPESFDLLATVLAAAPRPPTRDELAELARGVRLFPRRSELVRRTAELHLRHGHRDDARWLVDLGERLAPDEPTRARFRALRPQPDAAR